MSELKTVKLYGDLGEEFGKSFQMAVSTPAEALRLLCANFSSFAKFFVGDGTKRYSVFVGDTDLSLSQVGQPVFSERVIKIVPYVEGSTDNKFINIAIGAALIYAGQYKLGGDLLLGSFAAAASGIGWSLVIGGVSALLFTPAEPDAVEADENKPSYAFDGPVNTQRQGNPVPIGYGRLRIGSQVVSLGVHSTRMSNGE